MKPLVLVLVTACLSVIVPRLHAGPPLQTNGFEVIALGVEGGLEDGNLSAYLLRHEGDVAYLGLDAGSLLPGLRVALRQGAFGNRGCRGDLPAAGRILRQSIAGYFISHPHMDHVEGLFIAATDDTGHKPVYGLPSTNDGLSRDYLNWDAWPNMADRGTPPALGRYRLLDEQPGQSFAIEGTALKGTVYPLWHDRAVSSMLLACAGDACFAYFGDTGPDALGKGARLGTVWQVLAPLIRRHALKGMMIETSYPNDVPDDKLFGHLTPAWLLRELHRLEIASGGPGSLRGLEIAVTHIKPSLEPGRDTRDLIIRQLRAGNTLGVRFVFPYQGEQLHFPE